jgi:hypothetical protein
MCFQALFVPDSRSVFNLVQLIASVIKADRFYLADLACEFKLFRLQLVVQLPTTQKLRESLSPGDPDQASDRKFLFVSAPGFSHRTPANSVCRKIRKNPC